MKIYKIALICLTLTGTSGLLFAVSANLPGDNDKATTVIKVAGMACSSCAKRVEATLNKEAGVSSVELDAATGLATITYDKDATTPEKIAQNVTKETYFESVVVKDVQKEKSE